MKKLISTLIALTVLSAPAYAGDDKPNAKNVNSANWGMHIPGSKSANGVFFIFSQEACAHKYKGQFKGAEQFQLRKATIYKDQKGQPGKVVGQGCWSVNEEKQKLDYLGYQGEFNSDKNGNVMSLPWSDMFNASNAG